MAGWCSKHNARDFSTDGKISNMRRGNRQMELKPSTAVKVYLSTETES
jgi:hypothetical protein